MLPGRIAPPFQVVVDWVPVEFFANASAELAAEMAAVVVDFHPLGFRLMTRSLADTDTTTILDGITQPTLLLWVKKINAAHSASLNNSRPRFEIRR